VTTQRAGVGLECADVLGAGQQERLGALPTGSCKAARVRDGHQSVRLAMDETAAWVFAIGSATRLRGHCGWPASLHAGAGKRHLAAVRALWLWAFKMGALLLRWAGMFVTAPECQDDYRSLALKL
jgi:hypothetical protein